VSNLHSNAVTNGNPDILLIEDNPGDVCLMRIALDQCDTPCTLHTATDGDQAIRFLYDKCRRARRPALVLLDLNLPFLTGHEILEYIRSRAETRTLPVIVMSSSRDPVDVMKAYRSGANCYLHKPTDFDELIRIMRSLTQFWFNIVRLPEYPSQVV
jgi:two-component system, chemotaxis family, response regulator Rcp1